MLPIEADMFRHIGNNRNTLDVVRVDTEGRRQKRTVLTALATHIRPYTDFTLVARQPIPMDWQGFPLYIRCVEDREFLPAVSAGVGRELDSMDDGPNNDEGCCEVVGDDCETEEIVRRIMSKTIPVCIAPLGNQAFAKSIINHCTGDPFPFIKLYLNNQDVFMYEPCRTIKPIPRKRLVERIEMIDVESRPNNILNRDVLVVPFGHERVCRSHDRFIEGGCFDRR